MEHVAIDLGSKASRICVRNDEGQVIEELEKPTRSLRGYLSKRPKSRVILETCAEAFRIADAALELGHEVRVVPSTLVRSLGVGDRGIKTDARDARVLSEASCRIDLRSVHIPGVEARRRKALCTMREALVSSRTKLINTVRGWARQEARKIRSGAPSTFPLRARTSSGEEPARLPEFVERLVATIDHLNQQIAQADKEVAAVAEGDSLCKRLMTVPGVGPVSAVRFAAAVDRVERFPNAHALQSYLGLTPGENSSSERKRRTGLTKAGAPKVRWVLTQAAWAARNIYRSDPMVLWSLQVEKRRGRRIAIMALVRKLAGVLYAVWRDGANYDPSRLAPKG